MATMKAIIGDEFATHECYEDFKAFDKNFAFLASTRSERAIRVSERERERERKREKERERGRSTHTAREDAWGKPSLLGA